MVRLLFQQLSWKTKLSLTNLLFINFFLLIREWLKNCQGLTQWALVPLGMSLIPTNILNQIVFNTKPSLTKPFSLWFYTCPSQANLDNNTSLENTSSLKMILYSNILFWSFNRQGVTEQKYLGIIPMGLSYPWSIYYSNNCLEPPKFHYKNIYSKNVLSFIMGRLEINYQGLNQ